MTQRQGENIPNPNGNIKNLKIYWYLHDFIYNGLFNYYNNLDNNLINCNWKLVETKNQKIYVN